MGQVLHGSATTTEAIRRAIQHSEASLRALAKRYGINQKTVAKWKRRTSVVDVPPGPREPRSTVLTARTRPSWWRSAGTRFCRSTTACTPSRRRSPTSPGHLCIAAFSVTGSAACRRSMGRSLTRASSNLSDRLLPYRHRRGPDRAGKAPPVRRHRPHVEVRLRRATRESDDTGLGRLPPSPHRSRALQGAHGADRQWHPVHDAGRGRLSGPGHPGSHGKGRALPSPRF